MYSVIVPIMNENFRRAGREKAVERLRAMGVSRVFLALDAYTTDKEKQAEVFSSLRDNCAYLQREGFTVGAWIWAFMIREDVPYIRLTRPDGVTSPTGVCPSDDLFRRFAAEYIKNIARSGVDMILYDDDLRYGFLDCGGFGCTCVNHRKRMAIEYGKAIPDDLCAPLYSGDGNPVRQAFVRANGYYFRLFAEEMRRAVDEINPDVRIGVCACMDTWDMTGIPADELARVFAGKRTRPYLRLIGAPYWAVSGWDCRRLQDPIELERLELSYFDKSDGDIEVLAEGDVYPRPRTRCTAAYLELFDLALRADGRTDGIMKYVFDYTSSFGYEDGYVRRHIEHKALYEEVAALFSGAPAAGVRVWQKKQVYADMKIPAVLDGTKEAQEITMFSFPSRLLSSAAIPTAFEGEGQVGIAFAENVTAVPESALSHGMFLDIRAAEILTGKGVDVGLRAVGERLVSAEEYFPGDDEYVATDASPFYRITPCPACEILSYFTAKGERYPGTYFYRNQEGQTFTVFAFEGYKIPEGLYRHYAVARMLRDAIVRMTGKPVVATLCGEPDAYLIVKDKSDRLSVGVWNFSADPIDEPELLLDGAYRVGRTVKTQATANGNRVVLSPLPPFSFAAVELLK